MHTEDAVTPLSLAVDTQPAPHFGHPQGCPQHLHPVCINYLFFFSSVEKYPFDNTKACGLFICHRSTAEVEIFPDTALLKTCSLNTTQHGAQVFGHLPAVHAMALSLLVWGFYIVLSHLPGDTCFLFVFS